MSALEPISPLVSAAEKQARRSLAARAGVLALVLFLEKFFLNGFVSFPAAQAATGLGTAARVIQHFGLRFAVSLAIALALFVCVRSDTSLAAINEEARGARLRVGWLALHAALLVPLAAALYNLYGTHAVQLPFALLAASAALLTMLVAVPSADLVLYGDESSAGPLAAAAASEMAQSAEPISNTVLRWTRRGWFA